MRARISLSVLLAGCSSRVPSARPAQGCGEHAIADGGIEVTDCAMNADSASVFAGARSAEIERLRHQVPAGSHRVDGDQLSALVKILQPMRTSWRKGHRSLTSMCAFDPAFDLAVQSNVCELSLEVCFKCNELELSVTDEGTQKARSSFSYSFHAERGPLLAWAKSMFPGDAELAALH